MAKYYPINLCLKNKKCLVIGAGVVAERKIRRLLGSGALVSVVSPVSTPALKALWKKKKIVFKNRKFDLRDLSGAYMVIAATTDRSVNSAASSYCLKNNILVNVVDSPEECSFILPSVIRRGALTISISTDGVSPALSKKIRQDLDKVFGPEYADYLRIMKDLRPKVREKIKNMKSRKCFFKETLKGQIFDLLRQKKVRQVKIKLERILKNAKVS
ncbi:MAG: bifunctional precorrin-2 dehydrogenase/sirohydrochlorin ferrochelatase [Candidatus Omnitrophota bacterium]|nr:bifunctional precorrin-2 dehydrogenase/sirohydrochlorin ferrochelatase [Candidatus Omnitrophota bacterium]